MYVTQTIIIIAMAGALVVLFGLVGLASIVIGVRTSSRSLTTEGAIIISGSALVLCMWWWLIESNPPADQVCVRDGDVYYSTGGLTATPQIRCRPT